MTPEKDVNSDSSTDADELVNNEEALEGEVVSETDTSEDADITQENADMAAAEAAQEAAANEAGVESDDPLGFGDERMPDAGAASNGDAAKPAVELTEEEQLREQLAAAEAKAANHWDQLLRLQAEMENQRKRAQKELSNARKFALEGLVNDMLPIKDSLEMGIKAATEADAEPAKIIEGSELTLKMLSQAFEKYNIVEIDPLDEKFNPEFHQAMSMQPVEGKESNTVSGVLQKGYTLNDRLIRPALVMVAK